MVAVGGKILLIRLTPIKQLWYNDIGDTLKVKFRDGKFMTFDVVLKEFKFANLEGKNERSNSYSKNMCGYCVQAKIG